MHARVATFRISFAAVYLLGPQSFAATTTLALRCIGSLPSTTADGCFERTFHEFLGPLIHQLALERRRIITNRKPFQPVDTRSENPRRSIRETELRRREPLDEVQRRYNLTLNRERGIDEPKAEVNALCRSRGEAIR